jgi:hypothetical protein
MSINSENWVQNKIKRYLKSKGYKITHESKGHRHGVDIKCYHPKLRRYYFVEVKPEPRGWSEAAQRENYFLDVLGKILLRMNQKNGQYALGLPITYKAKVNKLPLQVRKNLGLDIFFVSKEGHVTRLPYYKKLKRT